MHVLGIETSCDETGVAVYSPEGGIVAEALASQITLHAPFGGVVPELASRDHVAKLAPMVRTVLADADLRLADLAAIAYTAGPGLIGALMVGGAYAVATAYGLGIRAIPVNHLEGHLLASMLEESSPAFPFLALLVSGGHTQLVEVEGLGAYRIIGTTLDDAAGEAFDKVARMLELPYPGGPALSRLAETGNPQAFGFPRPMRGKGLDFSFSGLKTAVRIEIESQTTATGELSDQTKSDIAASFQAAVADSLVGKCRAALAGRSVKRLVIAGGVGANQHLRSQLRQMGVEEGVEVLFPRPSLCTDNGAMIAYAGACRFGGHRAQDLRIRAIPRWPVDQLAPP